MRRASGRIPAGVWALGVVSLLMDVSSEMVHSLLPLFMVTTLGATPLAVGWVEGVAEGTALVVKVFSGALSDKLGRRKGLAVFGYSLSALTKPLFAVASTTFAVLSARIIDRVGKGIRGAPRDALVAELTAPDQRGAAFGLRQALDTVGACLGPVLATLLLGWAANDARLVFRWAVVPALLAVALLVGAVREPEQVSPPRAAAPISREGLAQLRGPFGWVVGLGAVMSMARFSEAFLVLRALDVGVPLRFAPLVMVAMNLAYAATAFPFGRLSDVMDPRRLLAWGLAVLFAADAVLAFVPSWGGVLLGVLLWGLHLGLTQGLLSALVAEASPKDARGTAFGVFGLVSGLALLAASALAGALWTQGGPASTFVAGSGFCLLALGVLVVSGPIARR
jgi:MFS family permease